MNFSRKGDLYIPDEEPITKGRSMVGYSRRSFFGLLAAFAIAPASESLFPPGMLEINLSSGALFANHGSRAYPKWRQLGCISDLSFLTLMETEDAFHCNLLTLENVVPSGRQV